MNMNEPEKMNIFSVLAEMIRDGKVKTESHQSEEARDLMQSINDDWDIESPEHMDVIVTEVIHVTVGYGHIDE